MFGKKSRNNGGNFLGRFRKKASSKHSTQGQEAFDASFSPLDVQGVIKDAQDEDALFAEMESALAQSVSSALETEHSQEEEPKTSLAGSDDIEAVEAVEAAPHAVIDDVQQAVDNDLLLNRADVLEISSEEAVKDFDGDVVIAEGTNTEGEFTAEAINDEPVEFDAEETEVLTSLQGVSLEKTDLIVRSPEIAPAPQLKPIFRSDGQQIPNHRLGRYVYERKLISADALDAASREQEVTGKPIGQILVKNGFLTDKQRVEAILSVEESRISQEQVSKSRIPVTLHDQWSIIISAEHDETIFVASPYSEEDVAAVVSEYYPEKKIEFVSYDPSSMSRFMTTLKRSAAVEDIRETKETMLDRIVYKALEMAASDIHITPQVDCYSVQFRIDGVKRIIRMGPLDEYHTVMAQVKDKATIDLAEKRKAQDGSYQVEYNGKMIDLRVATLPVQNGEHVTVRVLDSDRVHPNLDTLGITEVAKWRKGFKQRDGICIIAGATGSGKTTTLNSSLREIDRFGKSIFTIEDPVEYRVPFVNQVSVNTSVGLDFAAAVKAFMRNDPDVIILGEVRDAETARNAIKAADTGHLVLVTLHTGSIMGALSRMRDLGVEPRELRFMLRAVLVQSLIPRLCPVCKGNEELLHSCKRCNGEKYVGRTVASECEYFETVADVDRLLNARNDTLGSEERRWTSMAEDAVNQMRDGITDVPGLERTFGSQIYQYLSEEEKLLCSNL